MAGQESLDPDAEFQTSSWTLPQQLYQLHRIGSKASKYNQHYHWKIQGDFLFRFCISELC